jgi:hypothetical protein
MIKEAEDDGHEEIHDFRQALMDALEECNFEAEGEGEQDQEHQVKMLEGEGEGENGEENEDDNYHYMLMAMANQLLAEKLERQQLDAAMKFSMDQEN